MAHYHYPFEVHVHGEVALRPEVTFDDVNEALRPLWSYAGARSLVDGSASFYDEEPGILFDTGLHLLRMCWTVRAGEDFRQNIDEMCMNLNELALLGAAIQVSFYDEEFDEDEGDREEDARDDFLMVFVGPTPAAIMQVQRDMLVQDTINLMERHFEATELVGVVAEIDKLFTQRFDALVDSLALGKPTSSGFRARNKPPRHLH